MPTHAILITYGDMRHRLTELISKATGTGSKYTSFKELYFDSGWALQRSLRDEVNKIDAAHKLKIVISGHGGTGNNTLPLTTELSNRAWRVSQRCCCARWKFVLAQWNPARIRR